MITLRIKEIAEDKGLTLDELSNLSGVPLDEIESYTTIENLTNEIAANLRKIAVQLNLSVVELVGYQSNKKAFRFKVFEMAQNKGLTLEEISKLTDIHISILAFYSTQAICKEKLSEATYKEDLKKISEVLDCCCEDLQVEADLPLTRIDLKGFFEDTGLNLEDLSLLTGLPNKFIYLTCTQPVYISISAKEDNPIRTLKNIWCEYDPKLCE